MSLRIHPMGWLYLMLNVLDILIDAQKRFCEDPNSPDCRKRAELMQLMRERGV